MRSRNLVHRLARRSRTVTVALGATLVLGTLPVTAASAAPSPALPAELRSVLADSNRMRADQGFPANSASAERVLAAEGSGRTAAALVNDWGFIGTPAEAAEMARRDRVVRSLAGELSTMTKQPGYAGHFIDTRAGGKLVIQYAGSLPSTTLRSAVTARVVATGSSADAVEFRTVARSSAELTDAMTETWSRAGATGPVSAISEDVTTNGLLVSLRPGADPAPVDRALRERGITARFEHAAAVDEVCTSRNVCDSPRRGGVGISMPSGGLCSVGWVVTRSGVRGAVTAGHCDWGRTSGSVRSGSGTYGSINSINALSNGSHADMRFIVIPSGANPWLYQNAANKGRVVTGSALGATGQAACLFGRNSENPRCGTMSSTNASHTSNTCGCVVYGQSAANYASAGGDSGGAVASNSTGNVARGVHNAAIGSTKHYSWIGYTSTYNMGSLTTG